MLENQTVAKSFVQKIAYYIFLTLPFLVPVFFIPSSFVSTQFGTSLLFAYAVIVALLASIGSFLYKGQIQIPAVNKYGIGLFALVPIVYILAGISNGFSRMTFFGYMFDQSTVGFIFLSFIYLFLISMLFRDKKSIVYSHLSFLLALVVMAVFLGIRIIFGADVLSFGVFGSLVSTPVGTWTNTGIFFGIGAILSLLFVEILPLKKLMKALVVLLLLVSLFFVVLVNFQFIWVLLGLTALLYVIFTLATYRVEIQQGNAYTQNPSVVPSRTSYIKKIPLFSSFVLVLSVVFIFWGTVFAPKIEKAFNINNIEVRPSLAVTMDIARKTIQTGPLFGSGPNTFTKEWLSYRPDNVTDTVFWNTDFSYGVGILPTFAVTTGLVGVISWLVFFGFYLYLGWKSLFSKIEDVFVKYSVVSSFLVSLYLWCVAFVYVPSTVVFILTFFFTGLFLASAGIIGLLPLREQVIYREPRYGFIWALSLVAVFIAVLSLGYGLLQNFRSLWYFQKSVYAFNTSKDLAESERLMNQAVAIVPFDTYYRALSEIETAQLGVVASQDPKNVAEVDLQKQAQEVLSKAIGAGIAAKDADPNNYLNWISLGKVYQSATALKIQGAYESAQFAYGEALQRNPKNPGIIMLFALLEVDKGNLVQAKNYVMQAIQMKPNYLEAYYLLTQIEVANNNLKGAIESVTAVSILSPTDPTIFFQLGLLKFNAQDFVGAIPAFQESIKLSPQYANAKYYLGLSYEVTGQRPKAIQEFQDLKASNPDNKEVQTILNVLLSNKPLFTTAPEATKPGKSSLPVKENQ